MRCDSMYAVCRYASGKLELMFNATLLGGEGLLLRPFDANETGGWSANPFNDSSASYVAFSSSFSPFCFHLFTG